MCECVLVLHEYTLSGVGGVGREEAGPRADASEKAAITVCRRTSVDVSDDTIERRENGDVRVKILHAGKPDKRYIEVLPDGWH